MPNSCDLDTLAGWLSELPGAYHEKAYLLRALGVLLDGPCSEAAFRDRVTRSRNAVLEAAANRGGMLDSAGVLSFGEGKADSLLLSGAGRDLVDALRHGRIGLYGAECRPPTEGERRDWIAALDGPEPPDPTEADWFPPPELHKGSNIERALRHFGVETHAELRALSIRERERFMREMCDLLGLEFDRAPSSFLDASRGAAFARFFPDGFAGAYRNCVTRHLLARKDDVAIRYEREDGLTRTFTFAELDREIHATAALLLDLGLRPGDAVALQMPNTPEACAAFLACMLNRHAVVPLYEVAGVRDVAERMAVASVRAVLCADVGRFNGKDRPIAHLTHEAVALAAAEWGHGVERVIVWRYAADEDPKAAAGEVDWRVEAAKRRGRRVEVRPGDAAELAIVGFSSGSTGTPKGLRLTQTCMTYNFAKEAHLYADVRSGDVAFWLTRPAWIMWYWTLVGALANGASFLAYEGSGTVAREEGHSGLARVLDLAERHGITLLGTISSNCNQLASLKPEEVGRYDLGKLRVIGSTAEAITAEGWRAIAFSVGRGRVLPMSFIGGTDRGALNNSPVASTSQQACSVGGFVVECDGILVSEDGTEEPWEGEVAIRGPYPGQAQGLVGDAKSREFLYKIYRSRAFRARHTPADIDPERLAPGENDVWYHGDGYRRQNGRVGPEERAKGTEPRYEALGRVGTDRFKCGGIWVEPVRVEGAAEALPFVTDSMALQVPGGSKGWVLFVHIAEGGLTPERESAIKRAVEDVTTRTTLPDAILEVPAIPRNIARKKMHAVVRKLAQGESARTLPIGGMSHGERWVVDALEEAIRRHQAG